MQAIKTIAKQIIRFFYYPITFRVAISNIGSYQRIQNHREWNLRVTEVGLSDLPKIREVFPEEVAKKFAARIKWSTPYLIENDKETIGYYWASSLPVINEGKAPFFFDIAPKPGVVYVYDGFILDRWRAGGIMTAAVDELFALFKARKVKAAFIMFDKKNRATNRLSEKLGMTVIGSLRYRRFVFFIRRDLSALDTICE